MKAMLIFTVFLLNLYAETSGAENPETIDFRMLVGLRFCPERNSHHRFSFQGSTSCERDWRWAVERRRIDHEAIGGSGGEWWKSFFPEHALLFIALVPVRKGFDDVTLVSGREDAMNEWDCICEWMCTSCEKLLHVVCRIICLVTSQSVFLSSLVRRVSRRQGLWTKPARGWSMKSRETWKSCLAWE